MIINNEPYLIEYNVRMGDPECQVILPRLSSAICSEMPVPPYTHTARAFTALVNLRHSLPRNIATGKVTREFCYEIPHEILGLVKTKNGKKINLVG